MSTLASQKIRKPSQVILSALHGFGGARRKDIHFADRLFCYGLRFMGLTILGILFAIVWKLSTLSSLAFEKFGLGFFNSTHWNPVTDEYGALAFAFGTLVSSFLALAISAPISIGAALFITELAPKSIARVFGFLVEMLAAIPSVVYGLWGIFVLAPLLRTTVEPFLSKTLGFLPFFQGPPFGVGMLAAGIILAIMITPTICAFCREIFQTIPKNQREAALALGSTRWEAISLAVLKNSRAGIFGAIVLGLGRALGETMAVTMVIGNRPQISASLFAPAQTMASAIANEYAEATNDIHLSALAAIGFALFLVSLVTNGFARVLIWKVASKKASKI